MSLSGEEEGKRVERWKGAADAFHFDKSQTLPLIMMRMMMSMIMMRMMMSLIMSVMIDMIMV